MRSVALALLLSACSLAPSYERPKAPVAAAFADGQGSGRVAADLGWREVFGDESLRAIIALALENNRDLRIAALNIELARAQYAIEKSEQLPSIGLTATGQEQAAGTTTVNSYQVGVGITAFELDLFGRVRSEKEAALEQYFATVEARRATHLSLVAEVASQYLRIRALDDQRAIAEQTLETVSGSADLVKRLAEGGQRSDLDVRSTEAQVFQARAEIQRLLRERTQAENALTVLVGAELPGLGETTLEAQTIVEDLPAGLPLELLERRPDIMAAEHQLKSANASIGAARAAQYPQFSISAFLGYGKSFFAQTAGIAWTLSGQAVQPLFTYGRNKALVDASKVRKDIEVARYEQTIQRAFQEVADALVGRTTLAGQLTEQTARVDALQKRFAISDARYQSGIENYLVVLQAQQDLYTAQQQLVAIRLARLQNLVGLYKALGGGWLESSPPPVAVQN